MAQWDLDATFPTPNGNVLDVLATTTDGTDLYFLCEDTVNSDTFIYYYDVSGPSFTLWLQADFSSDQQFFDLAYFGSKLFFLWQTETTMYLSYATGPSAFTAVETIQDNSPNPLTVPDNPKFGRHDDFLRYTAVWFDDPYSFYDRSWKTKYTTDGTTWTIRTDPAITGVIFSVQRKPYKAGRDVFYVESYHAGTITTHYYLWEMLADTTFSQIITDTSPLTDSFFQVSQLSDSRFWADYPYNYLGSDRVRWSDDDWSTFDNLAKSFCLTDCSWVDIGYDYWLNTGAGVGGVERFLAGGTFGDTETFSGDLADITRTSPAHFIKIDDNSAYMILYYADTSNNATVWLRDEPLIIEGFLLLGMAVDDTFLYITGNEDETLKVFAFLLEDLSYDHEVSAGSASIADTQNRTYGIYPVIRSDGASIFLRGRDGNDRQVSESENQAVSFNDIGDSGWSASEYAAGLHVDPLRPLDMIVTFGDDDIYRTQNGGTDWVKINDAPVNLRASQRNMFTPSFLTLAGQSAGVGQLFFSPNSGSSTEDVSDAALGLINHIEQSL